MVAKQSVVFRFWKNKLKPNGLVAKYKARLIAKGFSQREKCKLLQLSFTGH